MENNGTTQQETTNTPTESVATNTESTTEKVDIQAILSKASEVAEKKSEAVTKSMLKQGGVEDEEVIKQIIADYKSKLMTPEKELEIERNKTIEVTKQLEAERQERIALKKGIPLDTKDEAEKKRVNACLTLANTYKTADITFEVALDKALEVISFEKEEEKVVPPSFYVDKGKISTNTFTEREKLINDTKKAMKIK